MDLTCSITASTSKSSTSCSTASSTSPRFRCSHDAISVGSLVVRASRRSLTSTKPESSTTIACTVKSVIFVILLHSETAYCIGTNSCTVTGHRGSRLLPEPPFFTGHNGSRTTDPVVTRGPKAASERKFAQNVHANSNFRPSETFSADRVRRQQF